MIEQPSDQAWTTFDHGEVAEPPHPSAAVDLRVARVLESRKHPNADRILLVLVDAGGPTPRQVVADIAGKYVPDELDGRHVVMVANLQPAEICGETSQGMLLTADAIPGTRGASAGAGEPADQITIVGFKNQEIAAGAHGITIDGARVTTPRLVVDHEVTGTVR